MILAFGNAMHGRFRRWGLGVIRELMLLAVGVGTGLVIGVTGNLLGTAIPLAMEVEW